MEIPATNPSTPKSRDLTMRLMVLAHALVWAGFFLWIYILVSEGQQASAALRNQYHLALPALTEWVLAATGWITSGIYLPLIFIVLFLAVDAWLLFILRHESKDKGLSWVWFVFLILLLCVILAVVKWALISLPQMKLNEALSR
jgi:hypothetical protein